MRSPNFFIIGAPKAGTTSLVDWLAQHPSVYMSPVKEPHFFNDDMGNNPIKSRAEYNRLFAQSNESHQAIGEASVWYMFSEMAVPNILEVKPDARFIVMLRDPAEMMISLHEQLYFSGIESERDVQVAWKKVEERRKGRSLPRFCIEPKLLDYKATCAIGTQVSKLISKVPRNNIMFIAFPELKTSPIDVFNRVQNFLELPPHNVVSFSVQNGAKERKSRFLMLLVFYANRIRRFLRVPRLNTGIMKKIDDYNRRYRERRVDEAFVQELNQYFLQEKELAEKVTGLKL